MHRALIIQLGRLGDVIQTTPLIRELAATGDTVDLLLLEPNHTAVLGLAGLATIYTISESLKSLDEAIARNFAGGAIPAEANELLAALHLPAYDRIINARSAAGSPPTFRAPMPNDMAESSATPSVSIAAPQIPTASRCSTSASKMSST
jgi:ADP-heptose:LPS heptosyltransferase